MYTSKIFISYGLQGNEENYGDNVIDFHIDTAFRMFECHHAAIEIS
ncbi:MAG: hypothetical protein F6K24_37310 [Okeania sp. SIO2D1]|nr:hypothetical protein [Okeania sp. SIO2D1]